MSEKGLLYRIGRIKALTGLDAMVAKQRLCLDVATLLYRLHPGLPAPGDRVWAQA